MSFDFEPTGEPKLIDKPDGTITIIDANGQELDITQWATSEATKYLGSLESLSNQKPQFEALLAKCNDFARVVKCGRLT